MAIFINYKKRLVVFTSYKVGYSTLMSQVNEDFLHLHYTMNFAIYKHLTKYHNFKRYMLVRHPYSRFASLFQDKFRKQPQRILEGLHRWEQVHVCLFPYVGVTKLDADATIAQAFMDMSTSAFLSYLPKVMTQDDHFMPQISSFQCKAFGSLSLPIKIHRFFRLEDEFDTLNNLADLNVRAVKNTSNSKATKQTLTSKDFEILNTLYQDDFKLGGYDMQTT